MDIALAIENVTPGANYEGSVADNTKESFEKIRWNDARKKPTWDELLISADQAVKAAADTEKQKSDIEKSIVDKLKASGFSDEEIDHLKSLVRKG